MVFFRSEEMARAWCSEHGAPLRPLVTMEQLWGLASAWYWTRLDEESRRPGADEMRAIFAGLGLDNEFWDPKSDRFGTHGLGYGS
jgi:hypothetical protein